MQPPQCVFQLKPSECHKPLVPRQCPAVRPEELLQRPWVFEDLVFYAHRRQQGDELYPPILLTQPTATNARQGNQLDVGGSELESGSGAGSGAGAGAGSGKKVSVNVQLDGNGHAVQVEVESIAQLISLLNLVQRPRSWGESEETRLNRVAAKQKLKGLISPTPPFRFLPTQNQLEIVLKETGSVKVEIVDNVFCRFSCSTFPLLIWFQG